VSIDIGKDMRSGGSRDCGEEQVIGVLSKQYVSQFEGKYITLPRVFETVFLLLSLQIFPRLAPCLPARCAYFVVAQVVR